MHIVVWPTIVFILLLVILLDIDYGLPLQVSTSMKNLCHDVFGVAKEKKDARDVKGNRGMSLKCLDCHFVVSILDQLNIAKQFVS